MPGFPNLDISGIESDQRQSQGKQDNEILQDLLAKTYDLTGGDGEEEAPNFEDAFGNESNPAIEQPDEKEYHTPQLDGGRKAVETE